MGNRLPTVGVIALALTAACSAARSVDPAPEPDADGTPAAPTPAAPTPAAPAPAAPAAVDAAAPRDVAAVADVMARVDALAIAGAPTRYPSVGVMAPITPGIAARLKAIAAIPGPDPHMLMRAGDANCWMMVRDFGVGMREYFWGCLDPVTRANKSKNLADHPELQSTIDYFLQGRVNGASPFVNDDVTCGEALLIDYSLRPDTKYAPTRWDFQVKESNPRYAVLMFGMSEQPNFPSQIGPLLLDVVDRLVARGTIPIVLSMPHLDPRGGPVFDVVQRAIAEARQVPFGSVYQAAFDAPKHGMGTWIHMSDGPGSRCNFTPEGLVGGSNNTILVALRLLDRVKRIVVDGAPAPDVPMLPPMKGQGTQAAPFEMEGLPFGRLEALSVAKDPFLADYSACGSGAARTDDGPGIAYHLHLDAPTPVMLFAFNRVGNPVEAHLYHFEGGLASGQCRLASTFGAPTTGTPRTFTKAVTLAAGDHTFVVDSRAGAGNGEFFFSITRQ